MDASSPTAAVQVTDDGGEQTMLNGVCDWANEEENIKADNTIYWSPDGSTILFASYDLKDVELLEYNTYGGPYKKVEKMDDRYPITRQIKYAKVTWQNDHILLIQNYFIWPLDRASELFSGVGGHKW